jgi:hypothetical protein
VAIGFNAGFLNQFYSAVAIGCNAGCNTQNLNAVAIGFRAGETTQGFNSVAIGPIAGSSNQGGDSIAIGQNAGASFQSTNSVAIGTSAGRTFQNSNSVAIGTYAGSNTQGAYTVAVGNLAGFSNQGLNSIGIGRNAGASNQSINSIALGAAVAQSNQGSYAIAIGYLAGNVIQSTNSIAIGNQAGEVNQNTNCLAIGPLAGNSNQNDFALALGYGSAQINQSTHSIAIGRDSAYSTQMEYAISIGVNAGRNNQATRAIAMGWGAGQTRQSTNAIAIGFNAGNTGQGSNAIAIGNQAGVTNQSSNSIILNASGSTLDNTGNVGLFINPVEFITGGRNVVSYNATTSEVFYSDTLTLSTISTSGQASFYSSVQMQGGLSVFSTIGTFGLAVASNTTMAGTLTVTGQATFGNTSNTGTLGVAGVTTLGSTDNNSFITNGGVWVKSKGISFSPTTGPGDAKNGAPWYGIGWANMSLGGGTASSLQIASYTGINFVTNTNPGEGLGTGMVFSGNRLGIATRSPQAALDVSGNAIINGSLGVGISPTFPLHVVGGANITGTTNLAVLSVSDTASIGNDVTLRGNGSGTVTVGSPGNTTAMAVNGTLGVTGVTTLSNVAVNGTLGVTGVTTLSNVLRVVGSIAGSVTADYRRYNGFGASALGDVTGGTPTSLSITTNGNIWCKGSFIYISSDERIKKNISTVSDSLDILNKLDIVSYDHIDLDKASVKHGLIAQEVKKHYPQAVSLNKAFIPSVYSIGTYAKLNENVIITSQRTTGFCVKDLVKLYISQDAKDAKGDIEYITDVLEIISDTQFTVKPWDNFQAGKDLLIYGKEVDDFLTLDKQQFGIIAAGACKILSEKVTALQATVAAQAVEITELKATVAEILQKISIPFNT